MTASIPHSPADELRKAAAKIRETAKEALSGFVSELPADWIAFYRRREDNGTLDRDDVAWINLMHPGLAEPLAAWLDRTADAFDWITTEVGGDADEDAQMAVGAPLALARVINGGAS